MPGSYKKQRQRQYKRKSENNDVDENSAVIQLFRQCQAELDCRHDKHERIVKHSRDVTIESKRIIFLLHRISGSSEFAAQSTLHEAEKKLEEIERTQWFEIAKELDNVDPYKFLRAYTHGLQEYIEALSFWYYLKENTLISLHQVNQRLQFHTPVMDGTSMNTLHTEVALQESTESVQTTDVEHGLQDLRSVIKKTETNMMDINGSTETPITATDKQLHVHIPPQEYMLGIADLTGELMRMAINSVGNGDLEKPAQLCKFMRIVYDAFVSFGNVGRDMNQKSRVLKQSLVKVENACYNLQVRGSEMPKHMLKDVFAGGEHGAGNDLEEFVGAGD